MKSESTNYGTTHCCCGPIEFKDAVNNGWVRNMTRAEYEPRYNRWINGTDDTRPPAEIDKDGNLIGPDGIITSGWRATYMAHLIESHMVKEGVDTTFKRV